VHPDTSIKVAKKIAEAGGEFVAGMDFVSSNLQTRD
jgi:hypothetical protein